MALPNSLILASEVIGFLSFGFTLLTALGVYTDLIKTLRGAPSTIPIALGNLREEIRYETQLCNHNLSRRDHFHILPTSKRPGKRTRTELSHLLSSTLRHLWTEFCAIERQFLVTEGGETPPENLESSSESTNENEKPHRRRRHRHTGSHPRPRPDLPVNRPSYMRSRMGWIEAGLSRDRQTYYNTDLAHRFLWWWKKDDVGNLAQQVQRIQIRRVERDAYETNILVQRGLRMYGRVSGDDVYDDSTESDGSDGGRRGSGGGRSMHGHRRRRSSGRPMSGGNRYGGRRGGNGAGVHGRAREVLEKEVVRGGRGSSLSPHRRSASVVGSARGRPSRGSVVYEYEVLDPGRIHVEYGGMPRDRVWQEGRQRSFSRPRDGDDDDGGR